MICHAVTHFESSQSKWNEDFAFLQYFKSFFSKLKVIEQN